MREPPKLTPGKRAERAARDARLAAALRANLQRRKEQVRARSAGGATPGAAAGGLSGAPRSSKSGSDGEEIAD
jgi:hypothetical protein